MEKTNLSLAFIVRRWVIETLVLSQNANRNLAIVLIGQERRGFDIMGSGDHLSHRSGR